MLLSTPALAAPASDLVRRALGDAGSPRLTQDARLARLTVALASLDALPPDEALATLSSLAAAPSARAAVPALSGRQGGQARQNPTIAAGAPRVARRAALELARLLGEPPPDEAVSAVVCEVPRTQGAPLVALTQAHAAAPTTCRRATPAHTFELTHPTAASTTAFQLRIAVRGGETVYLAADGDLLASVVHRPGPMRHSWLGHALGLRSGRVSADDVYPAPDQLALELPRDASELVLTVIPATPGARLSLSIERPGPVPTAPSAPAISGPPLPLAEKVPALELPPGAAPPAPTLADTDLFGHAARRLLGLPDLGPSLEERLGLETLAIDPDSPAPGNARPIPPSRAARPLSPTPEELVLVLPALTRPDQRASVLGLHLPRAGKNAHHLELALAHLALDRGHVERARAAYDALPAATRDGAAGRYLAARLARYAGQPEDTLALYTTSQTGLSTLSPPSTLSTRERLELAQAATELGRADLSAALRKELAGQLPGRLDLGTTAMAALVSAGDVATALDLADALSDRHPGRPLLALDAAERHLAHDSTASRERALALTRRALAAPQLDADALVRAGLLLEALDDAPSELARATFARALAESPGHPTARRHLERLANTSNIARNPLTPPSTAGSRDPAFASLLALPIRDESAPFEVLTEEIAVEVASDGTSTRWVRRVLRAQRVPEQREARTLRVRFDPSRESVTVLSAHIHRQGPRARRETVVERHVHSLTEDWYGLYYDLRQLSIPFDRLERGDLVEVSWRVDPVGQLFPGVVDLFEILADRIPKHQLRLTVTHPQTLSLQHRLSLPPGYRAPLSVTETTDGDLRRLTVTGRDLPALPLEPLAPGAAEVAPVWQLTSFGTWDELARWYTRLIEPSRVVTPALRELVATLTRGRSRDESIRAITSWVTREIRYVGLEFGIHGYRPYRTDEVFSRRFGDCKDKATLLTTLLSIAGIDSSVVLVRTRKQGRLENALPSLALFDHAIAWLPSRLQLVDPTAIHHGLGELPREDQGAQILTLPADPSADSPPTVLALSPTDPASRNGIIGRYAVTVDGLGRGGLSAEVSMLGVHAPLYRSMLLEPATRHKRFEEVLNRRYPGLSLTSLEVSDPADHHRPIDLAFTAEVPRLASRSTREAAEPTSSPPTPLEAVSAPRAAQSPEAVSAPRAAQSLHIPRPAGVDGQLERLAPEPSRTLPLYLGPPTRWDLRFRYVFPERHEVVQLPPGGDAESPFGRFKVRFSADPLAPHTIDVETELELTVDQVSAADYPALREFLASFDRAVATALVAHPSPAPPTPTTPPEPTPPETAAPATPSPATPPKGPAR